MDQAEELPGVKKQSFPMFFHGGEIWFEHLDGIYQYTALAIQKLKNDSLRFRGPSKPSLIAINLDETLVNDPLIEAIAEALLHTEKRFTRVVFVGVNRPVKRKIKKLLFEAPFAYCFLNDFEKAKEWLVTEGSR